MSEKDLVGGVIEKRTRVYGQFRDIAAIAQGLEGVVMASPRYGVWPVELREAVHMIFHKIARLACGDPLDEDSAVDIVGYAELWLREVGRIQGEGRAEKKNSYLRAMGVILLRGSRLAMLLGRKGFERRA